MFLHEATKEVSKFEWYVKIDSVAIPNPDIFYFLSIFLILIYR